MKFYIHKLGCPKNDVDADYIAARLVADGHEAVRVPDQADSILVNTCGFIQAAKEESVEALLSLGQLKQSGRAQSLYATGCLSQRYGDELLKEMPELDGAFGHGALDSIARAVRSRSKLDHAVRREVRQLGYLSWRDRFIYDDYPYTYLKISDGCDRTCTYCAIPAMRGHFRSRPISSIVNEAKFLADNGKRELILVSQEATLYGYDLPERPHVVDLLEALSEVKGVEWIRLMYLYPGKLDERLISYMFAENKTLPYFDLPLQHVDTKMLQRMRRQVDKPTIEQLLQRIRGTGRDTTLRTTFIVGFPGETEDDFEELKEFVSTWRFERMGVFPYSAEEGTPAATMPEQVPEDLKQARCDELMTLQREIAFDHNETMIGRTLEVLIDEVREDGSAVGRSWADCPDIDQEVIVHGQNLRVGTFCPVRVESVDGYELIARQTGEGR